MEDWDRFDVFKVARLTDGRPLQTVGLNLLRKRGLIGKLQLAEDRLAAFLQARRGVGGWRMVGGKGDFEFWWGCCWGAALHRLWEGSLAWHSELLCGKLALLGDASLLAPLLRAGSRAGVPPKPLPLLTARGRRDAGALWWAQHEDVGGTGAAVCSAQACRTSGGGGRGVEGGGVRRGDGGKVGCFLRRPRATPLLRRGDSAAPLTHAPLHTRRGRPLPRRRSLQCWQPTTWRGS